MDCPFVLSEIEKLPFDKRQADYKIGREITYNKGMVMNLGPTGNGEQTT